MTSRRTLAAAVSAILVLPATLSTSAVAADNQVLFAPNDANWIGAGGAGHDFVGGRLGNDTVSGGGGNDFVVGDHPEEWVWGPSDVEPIVIDVLKGNVSDGYAYYAEHEPNKLHMLFDHVWYEGFGSPGGNDRVTGGAGRDILGGGNGHDEVCGRADDIAVFGGGGTDVPCPVFTGLISTATGSGNLKAGMRDLDDEQLEVNENGNHNPYAFVLPGRTPVSSAGEVDTYRTAKAIVKLHRRTGAVNVSARSGAAGVEKVAYTVRRRVVTCADYSAFDFGYPIAQNCTGAPAPAFRQAKSVTFRIGIPPNTTITEGARRWELRKRPAFKFGSDDPAATFQCSYDGATFSGCASGYRPPFAVGTHVLRVRARNAAAVDPSPASRRWTHPHDDRQLAATAGWRKVTGSSYYLGTARVTTAKGQVLKRDNVRAKALALVATRCPGCGTVKIYYGSTMLKQVSLSATTTRHRQVIPIASWARAQSAKRVRIVVVSGNKKVVIDGLGIATS